MNDYVFSLHKDFPDFVFPSCDFISFSFFKYTFTLNNCGSGTLANNFSALKTTSGTLAGSHTASAKSQMDAFFSSARPLMSQHAGFHLDMLAFRHCKGGIITWMRGAGETKIDYHWPPFVLNLMITELSASCTLAHTCAL